MSRPASRSPIEDDIRPVSATSTPNRQSDHILDPKLKKRETDRRAQRACRQRQKDRIAYLEALVQELREGRGSDTETSKSPHDSTHLRSHRKRSTVPSLDMSLSLTQV